MSLCIDCGIDTAPMDDRRRRGARPSEYYMVHDEIWLAAGMPKSDPTDLGHNFLCIGCLERRLGRQLARADFIDIPLNRPHRWSSPRLNDRLAD